MYPIDIYIEVLTGSPSKSNFQEFKDNAARRDYQYSIQLSEIAPTEPKIRACTSKKIIKILGGIELVRFVDLGPEGEMWEAEL